MLTTRDVHVRGTHMYAICLCDLYFSPIDNFVAIFVRFPKEFTKFVRPTQIELSLQRRRDSN
ncbi:hypothetical protein WK77_16195 [Burkholderia ubonensis]|nr:hypothetical protein WK77_16195 [Burkholderia ubonensis]